MKWALPVVRVMACVPFPCMGCVHVHVHEGIQGLGPVYGSEVN